MVSLSSLFLSALVLTTAAAKCEYNSTDIKNYCAGTNYTTNDTYICGDKRLGPSVYPTQIPINVTTIGFRRYEGMCPGAYLKKYWNDGSDKTAPLGWRYPPMYGYLAKSDGSPLNGTLVLKKGLLIDRFGHEYGKFFAPFGTPFEQRALPPDSLNTSPDRPDLPANYWVFEVMQDFEASGGTIASGFGQPGYGTQFQTYMNLKQLNDTGYIKHRPWKEIFGDGDAPSGMATLPDNNAETVLEL